MKTATLVAVLESVIVAGHVAAELALDGLAGTYTRLAILGVHAAVLAWHWFLLTTENKQRAEED